MESSFEAKKNEAPPNCLGLFTTMVIDETQIYLYHVWLSLFIHINSYLEIKIYYKNMLL